jgi:hypothetical protein
MSNRQNKVTQADIEANIVYETYIHLDNMRDALPDGLSDEGVRAVTICVLVTRSGYVVLGKSACVSMANYDIGIGEDVARKDAINELWSLMGYELKERLFREGAGNGLPDKNP